MRLKGQRGCQFPGSSQSSGSLWQICNANWFTVSLALCACCVCFLPGHRLTGSQRVGVGGFTSIFPLNTESTQWLTLSRQTGFHFTLDSARVSHSYWPWVTVTGNEKGWHFTVLSPSLFYIGAFSYPRHRSCRRTSPG